jgi:Tol biopolymer transport system component
VISPDGRHIAYTTAPEETLWIQDLDQNEPRKIAAAGYNLFPFWSPGGDFVAFRSHEKELKKISVHGGRMATLCETPQVVEGQLTWNPDGTSIVFGAGFPSRLYEVPADGGTPKLLFQVSPSESAQGFQNPHFPPGEGKGHRLIFDMGSPGNTRIVAQDLESGRREFLGPGTRPFYSPTGHVVYEVAGDLWAVPFSVSTLQRAGEPFPIRQHASMASVARDGTLVYLAVSEGLQQLVWRDRKGLKLGAIGQPQRRIELPRLSPDRSRVAVQGRETAGPSDIWIHDVARGSTTRLTSHPTEHDRPIWMPHGDTITFTSARNGNPDIFTQPADGSREPEVLVATPDADYPYDWSQDGKYLIYVKCASTNCDLWYLRAREGQGGYDAIPFIQTPSDEFSASFSPDGRYLAYASDESGRNEVYVRRFPEGGAKKQISTNGGVGPRWRQDGKELFYTEGDWVIAVSTSTTPALTVGASTRLFQDKNTLGTRSLRYDVTPDGQRFVFPETLQQPTPTIHVVQNWFAEFREHQRPRGGHE